MLALMTCPAPMFALETSPLLRARGLCKSFGGVRAVRDISLAIPQGIVFAVIGPNGAGKSTLVKTLLGKLTPTSGEVKLGFNLKIGYFDQKLGDLVRRHAGQEAIHVARKHHDEYTRQLKAGEKRQRE